MAKRHAASPCRHGVLNNGICWRMAHAKRAATQAMCGVMCGDPEAFFRLAFSMPFLIFFDAFSCARAILCGIGTLVFQAIFILIWRLTTRLRGINAYVENNQLNNIQMTWRAQQY